MYGEALRDEETRRGKEKGKSVLGESNGGSISGSLRATLFLNRAECYRQMGEIESAKEIARKLCNCNRKTRKVC